MLDQSINPDSLRFVISDFERNVIFKDEFNIDGENALLEMLIEDFKNKSFNLPTQHILKGKAVYKSHGLTEYFLTKRFITSFRTVNSVKQANRNHIVDGIIALIKEYKPYTIIRLDIKDFYESIDRKFLLNKVHSDNGYSSSTVKILEKLFDSFKQSNIQGLPRGLGVSAILSEYYIRDFDKKCRDLKEVFFYARFVDDIIIFTMDENLDILELQNYLPSGLTFHNSGSKFKKIHISTDNPSKIKNQTLNFSYLGYEFTLKFLLKNNNKLDSIEYLVDISSDKVKKIKTRLVKAFLDYNKNNDFALLFKRVKFLTLNYVIHNANRDTKVKSGIYYNYRHITDEKINPNALSLNDLDKFLRTLIYNDRISRKIFGFKHKLNRDNKKLLARLSFKQGYKKRRFERFSIYQFKQIKKCWAY